MMEMALYLCGIPLQNMSVNNDVSILVHQVEQMYYVNVKTLTVGDTGCGKYENSEECFQFCYKSKTLLKNKVYQQQKGINATVKRKKDDLIQ